MFTILSLHWYDCGELRSVRRPSLVLGVGISFLSAWIRLLPVMQRVLLSKKHQTNTKQTLYE